MRADDADKLLRPDLLACYANTFKAAYRDQKAKLTNWLTLPPPPPEVSKIWGQGACWYCNSESDALLPKALSFGQSRK